MSMSRVIIAIYKIFAISLAFVLTTSVFAYAQEEAVVPSEPTPVIVESTEIPADSNASASTAETVLESAAAQEVSEEISAVTPLILESEQVQETASSTQTTTDVAVLEDTANPEAQVSEAIVVTEVTQATSTEEVIQIVAEPVVPVVPAEELSIEEPVLDVVAESLPVEIAPEQAPIDSPVVEIVELKADVDPEYVVALSGNIIPTKKHGVIGTSPVTLPIETAVDAQTGVLSVSGSCSSAYFVVLIFKNQDDYEKDPRSFIMNKAFPCTDGMYSYSIDKLPPTLANGTYYLLIGEQGERSSWTPVTSLTEISINRSN